MVPTTIEADTTVSSGERLKKLAELSLTLTGEPASIFRRIAQMIGEMLDVRVVCLSEIRGDELYFISVYVDGKVMLDAGHCPLSITPCATVESTKDLRIYERVIELFPEATFLKEHHAHSYCGFPALDANAEVLAVTCLLDDKPHEFSQEDQDLLRIFGQRIAFEIERKRQLDAQLKAEQVLMKREQHYRHLVETAHAIPWTFDMRTMRFTYVGPQAEAVLGYLANDWYGDDFWPEHIHPEDRDWAVKFCMTSAANCEDHDFEYRMIAADGRVVWIRDSVNVLADENGPYELHGFMFDVTERKDVEKAHNSLAEIDASNDIQEFYRLCVLSLAQVYGCQYAFIGLIADDARSRVKTQAVWAGSEFADNFEYELEGTPCAEILEQTLEIVPKDAAEKYPDDVLLAEMGVDSYFGAPLVTSDGDTIGLVSVMDTKAMELTPWIHPVLGMFANRIAAEVDRHHTMEELEHRVEERTGHLVEAREEALRANSAKSEFLSRMSHELRTPLNAVIGFAQLLAMRLDEQPEHLESVSEIIEGGEHLLKLIEEVLDLSRIEMGTIMIQSEPIDISTVITESLRFIRPQAEQRGISIEYTNKGPTMVVADKVRLKEILLNLFSNAVKYNNDKGKIIVEYAKHDQSTARIDVRDTGPGLDSEQLSMLFEPFSRLGAEYSGIEGTGIGLSIVKKLVELMGGEITVDSMVGRGTNFSIHLPLAAQA